MFQISHSPLYLSLPLCIYPAENIQRSAGDHPSNAGECQTPQHPPAKTYFQLFLATPTDWEQWNSSPSSWEIHCPLSVRVARNSWKHRLCWPLVWRLSESHRHLAVDVALVCLHNDQVDEGLHVRLSGEGGPELRRVPEHHAVGDQHYGQTRIQPLRLVTTGFLIDSFLF